MTKACPEWNHQFQSASDAQDDAGAIAIEFAPGCAAGRVPCIDQGLVRAHKAQELRRVGGFDVLGCNTEIHGVELHRR